MTKWNDHACMQRRETCGKSIWMTMIVLSTVHVYMFKILMDENDCTVNVEKHFTKKLCNTEGLYREQLVKY